MIKFFILLILILLLPGCTDTTQPVPVAEPWRQPLDSPITYTVKREDSLYSIAWFYGLDFRQVAAVNGIDSPYAIHTGQKLRLGAKLVGNAKAPKIIPSPAIPAVLSPKVSKIVAPIKTHSAKPTKTPALPAKTRILLLKMSTISGITWSWPARGCIIGNFSSSSLNKGIDISGKLGTPITAAADGKVVYAGNGLRGYGELIIIKHSDEFLSAYAHNQKILIQDGQEVKRGQIIALMGNSDARCVMLHFEVRKAGKPVDPNCYLPN